MCYSYSKWDIVLQYRFDELLGMDKDIVVCDLKGEANSVQSSGRPGQTVHLSVIDGPLAMTYFGG